MNRTSAPLLLVASGCLLAPGMKLNESEVQDRARPFQAAAEEEAKYGVIPLTPTIVTKLATERAGEARSAVVSPAGETTAYEYRVAPLDILSITVWDHPELTAPVGQFRSPEENGLVVAKDGSIFYPYVGKVRVDGRSVDEIRDELARRLTRYVENPQVSVRVAAFRGKRVQVTGEVLSPSTIPITDVPLRVQDALAFTKGFTSEADPAHLVLGRRGQTHVLDLQAYYERGDLSQNWLLEDGDVVNVPDRSHNKVFVVGEVRRPGSRLMVKGRMTLAEALNDSSAGGAGAGEWLEPVAANPARIYVIRGQYERPTIYKLDASNPDAMLLAVQFPMQPRDVVFVSTYELSRWNRVITQILPTVQAIWQTFDLTQRTFNR